MVGTPERLSLATMAALCDILACTPSDLIEVVAETRRLKKVAGVVPPTTPPSGRRPRRARIVTDGGHLRWPGPGSATCNHSGIRSGRCGRLDEIASRALGDAP